MNGKDSRGPGRWCTCVIRHVQVVADISRSDDFGNDDTWHGSLNEMHNGECEALDSSIYLTLKDLQISVEFGARTVGLTRTGVNWSVHHYVPK